MAAAVKDSDAEVTFEDQQRINKFARFNSKLMDLKEEMTARNKEMENLNDAEEEMLMLEEDGERIPYQIGEVLIEMELEEAQASLEKAKEMCQENINALKKRQESFKETLGGLKTQLYAKFGTNINLDQEEDS